MNRPAIPGWAVTVVSVAALASCFGVDPRECGGVTGAGEDITLGASGSPLMTGDVRFDLSAPRFSLCPSGLEYPTVTGVRLVDPAGQPVPVTWEVVQGRKTQVAFHSDVSGMYQVELEYTPDPRTGRAVKTIASRVMLALDRSQAPRAELGAHCDALRRTAQGTWLCDNEVIRGTTRVESLPPEMKYLVEGSSVWGVSPDGHDVARWEDTGSGTLSATGTMTSDAGTEMGQLHSLAATSDELLVRYDHGLVQYRWAAEPSPSLSLAGESTSSDWPPPALPGWEMTWKPPLIAMAGDGVCINTLDAGTAVVTGQCLGNVFAKTADGYWTFFPTPLQPFAELSVHAMQGDGTFRKLETFRVPLGYPESWPWSMTIVSRDPDRRGEVLMIPKVQPGGPAFEDYTMRAPHPAGVERDYVWWHLSDGGTEVVFR